MKVGPNSMSFLPRVGAADWARLMKFADDLQERQREDFFARFVELLNSEYERHGRIDADGVMLAAQEAAEAAADVPCN